MRQGQVLLTLEAMKMQQHLAAPFDGVIDSVRVRQNDSVAAGQVLLNLSSETTPINQEDPSTS